MQNIRDALKAEDFPRATQLWKDGVVIVSANSKYACVRDMRFHELLETIEVRFHPANEPAGGEEFGAVLTRSGYRSISTRHSRSSVRTLTASASKAC